MADFFQGNISLSVGFLPKARPFGSYFYLNSAMGLTWFTTLPGASPDRHRDKLLLFRQKGAKASRVTKLVPPQLLWSEGRTRTVLAQ
jgi:hypothetical protein